MSALQLVIAGGGLVLLFAAAVYAVLALVAVLVWNTQRPSSPTGTLAPVTVLKPLCGLEPGLCEHLRSFFQQDYPHFQLVFGVRESSDPALEVVARLAVEFPGVAIDVVVNPRQYGSNAKISNLINMLARARHELIAMADSDTYVGPDWLTRVTAPLAEPCVGLVSCLYRGVPTVPMWSRLGAMYINEWYGPLVLVAWLFGHRGYVSGQTLCLRRDTLQAIGGLPALADQLAEDYRLGELVRAHGLGIVLSPYLIHAQHHEPDLRSLLRHELRWMRTIRALQPWGFGGLFPTFTLPLTVLGIALIAAAGAWTHAAAALGLLALLARLGVHFAPRGQRMHVALAELWLLPVRDVLIGWVWCRSFFSSRISWRGGEFAVDSAGIMRRVS